MQDKPTPKQAWETLLKRIEAARCEAAKAGCSFNKLPFSERLKLGKVVEVGMLEFIRACGLPLKPSSEQMDMHEKVDVGIIYNGEPIYGQMKWRVLDHQSDIIVDVYEPWYGLDHPATQPGRDNKGSANFYVTLVKGKDLYISWIRAQRPLIRETVEAWKDAGCPWGGFKLEPNGVDIRGTTDKGRDDRGGYEKILAFIPPDYLVEKRGAFKFNLEISETINLRETFKAFLIEWLEKYDK